jgi:hypothetical protein
MLYPVELRVQLQKVYATQAARTSPAGRSDGNRMRSTTASNAQISAQTPGDGSVPIQIFGDTRRETRKSRIIVRLALFLLTPVRALVGI